MSTLANLGQLSILNENGWRWSQQLQLFLGLHNQQLRFFTPNKTLVPSLEELAAQTDQERQKATRLAEKLRELGIDPEV